MINASGANTHIRYYTESGVPVLSELVWFIPDVDVNCDPPYKKGVIDCVWVSYLQGSRPTTKRGWEILIGMPIQEVE